MNNTHELTDSDVATILCALRLLQELAEKECGFDGTEDSADDDEFKKAVIELDHESEHFQDCDPLTSSQIDDLCEFINCS